ncbi:hypothetical protein EQM14_10995 [Caproiciproducens sp. NJN-50]|uniref:hypothetical protein n=1 Tax=Acutalibacteraceae TaxID=3082771 RepID=UPI000FFE1325|nr:MULTISPECIES: hypothetical protein [Acutalibacteraceae]QAT50247.1 hypothetical protein EQM14_10995 [Caproiciproducens sp. NJN-50]
MNKQFRRVISSILTLALVFSTCVSAFAAESKVSSRKTASVTIVEQGVYINGNYYSQNEFISLLDKATPVSQGQIRPAVAGAAIAAGAYFIPGVGEVLITATGAIIVAGVIVTAGTWLYNTVTHWFAEQRALQSVIDSIPSRLRSGNSVDLGKFNQKVSGKSVKYKEKGGWTIEKDRAGDNSHGGSEWKLKNPSGERKATLDKDGKVLRK